MTDEFRIILYDKESLSRNSSYHITGVSLHLLSSYFMFHLSHGLQQDIHDFYKIFF